MIITAEIHLVPTHTVSTMQRIVIGDHRRARVVRNNNAYMNSAWDIASYNIDLFV